MHDKNIYHRTGGKINEEPEGMMKQNCFFGLYKKYKNKRNRQAQDPVQKNPLEQEKPTGVIPFQYGPSGLWT
jgi:hypothetical protein